MVKRTKTVPASAEAVWAVVADPQRLPEWFPRVKRVEGISETGFTEVLYTRKGRPVRIDQHYNEVEPGQILGWEQEISGTQFEALLSLWRTRVSLEPDGAQTRVCIEEEQRFRGNFGLGSMFQRRAAVRRIEGALRGLADLF
ncbi:MAG: SRPBCC family protein [Solirubrobacterales bacterium]|nr:SRPBCC family protein [Solirubrobacterales bacterium]